MCALRTGFVEHHPDHRWHLSVVHAIAEADPSAKDVVEFAAEAMGEVHGWVAFCAVLGITGRQDDPGLDGSRVTPEAGKEGALKLFELGHTGDGLCPSLCENSRAVGIVFRVSGEL
jgi:hypothetical protein